MTKTVGITWAAASARRLERQFLAMSARTGTPVADVAGAMLGVHAQVLSAAELSVGLRTDGVTRMDVRAALWPSGSPSTPPSLVKTHGPRGQCGVPHRQVVGREQMHRPARAVRLDERGRCRG
jgi:hypothetical protein